MSHFLPYDREECSEKLAMNDDKALLLATLQAKRAHVLKTVDNMPEEFLVNQTLPSRWSPAGLVHHLTHDVERFWFLKVLLDDPEWSGMPHGTEAWDIPEGMSGAEIIEQYRDETAVIDDLLTSLDVSTPPKWWDDSLFGHGGPADLREIVLHVIVETATHAGHMDIVRELLDGHQNMVFTDESRPGRL